MSQHHPSTEARLADRVETGTNRPGDTAWLALATAADTPTDRPSTTEAA